MPSDATADGEIDVEGAGGEKPKKKLSGKKLVLIVGPVLLLLIVGAALYFLGFFGGAEEEGMEEMVQEETVPLPMGFFYDLPNLIVNLKDSGRRPSFLKLAVSLELGSEEDVPLIEQIMPRIIDNFQVYLRELRVEDLRGSQGLLRLREELLRRVTIAARPTEVRDILFREMLIQ